MAGVNKVILLGNLGKDPEINTLESGVKVARFPLATNDYYKGRDGERWKRPNGTRWFYGETKQNWPKNTLPREARFTLRVVSRPVNGKTRKETKGIPRKLSVL